MSAADFEPCQTVPTLNYLNRWSPNSLIKLHRDWQRKATMSAFSVSRSAAMALADENEQKDDWAVIVSAMSAGCHQRQMAPLGLSCIEQ